MAVTLKERVKKNYINSVKRRPSNHEDKWKADFHFAINSKAFFGLSEQAFKLYCSLILNGKKNFTSLNTLAIKTGKSIRQIQRVKKELEDEGFLKLRRVNQKAYEYLFDYTGRLNEEKPKKVLEEEYEILKPEIENVEKPSYEEVEEQKIPKEVVETKKESSEKDLIISKAKSIIEYSDFAILDNKFWSQDEETKKEILEIIENRLKNEKENEDQLRWIYEKISF